MRIFINILLISFYLCTQANAQVIEFPAILEQCIDPLISKEQQVKCSNEYISNFINEELIYPDSARNNQIEGVVVVRFTIDSSGELTKAELIRNIGYDCGQEALRIVRQLPKFRAALSKEQPVLSEITVPIRFRALDKNPNNATPLYRIQWSTAYGKTIKVDDLKKYTNQAVTVRDHYGEIYKINSLEMSYIFKRQVNTAKGNSPILTKEMLKFIKKARAKGAITLTAHFKKGKETIEVYREFDLIP